MTNPPTVRPNRFFLGACAVVLVVSSVACRSEPPPPIPSPLPVAACAALRSVEADADLVALYARVADGVVAGSVERRDYLSWGFPEGALRAGIDPRPGAIRAIAGWLDLTLGRQSLARDTSFDALYEAFRHEEGAAGFLVDGAHLGTEIAFAFDRFRQALQTLAADVAFPVPGSNRPDQEDAMAQSWRKDDCAIRARLDELRKRWGCEAMMKGRPDRPDGFDRHWVDHPYVTWTVLGLPQCEFSNPSRPANCYELASQKPFLPHCGEAPAAGAGEP